MLRAILTRQECDADGVRGELVVNDGLRVTRFKTLERPWLDNANDVSCILPKPGEEAVYPCAYLYSPKHAKNVYHVQNVPGRTVIEIHSANVFIQLLGCIALGKAYETFPKGARLSAELVLERAMLGVTESKAAIAAFEQLMGRQPFELQIKWAPGVGQPKEAA